MSAARFRSVSPECGRTLANRPGEWLENMSQCRSTTRGARRGVHRLLVALAAAAGVFVARDVVQAQPVVIEGGTYIGYLGMADNGILLSEPSIPGQAGTRRSFRYREEVGHAFSADYFRSGPNQTDFGDKNGFVVEAGFESAGGTSETFLGRNLETVDVSRGFGPVRRPDLSGNSLEWSGSRASSVDASASMSVTKRATILPSGRAIRVDVTLRNTGARNFSQLHYMYFGDPNPGAVTGNSCFDPASPINCFATENDVLRQAEAGGTAPLTDNSLVAASSRNLPNNVALGMGTFDLRARAHAGTIRNTSPRAVWDAPDDPNGLFQDVDTALVFRLGNLNAGASVSVTYFFVLGPNADVVEDRFDDLRCSISPDLTECLSGGEEGLCRAGQCCVGCWDGTACRPGSGVGACGVGGLLCVNCSDGNACTQDSCNPGGTCSSAVIDCDDGLDCTTNTCNPASGGCQTSVVSGCAIDNACWLAGQVNPTNDCQKCEPSQATTAWTNQAAGTLCDDGLFCTGPGVERCDDSGRCIGEPRVCPNESGIACAVGACDEASQACTTAIASDSCFIDGQCIDAGTPHPTETCLACVPSKSQDEWSVQEGACLIDGACIPAGTPSPDNRCLVCDPQVDDAAYSPAAPGVRCGDPSCVGGVLTPAPLCDGQGVCAPRPDEVCVDNVCADAISCTGECETDLDCLETQFCDLETRTCQDRQPDGDPCRDASECDSGICADGVCCESRCDGVCVACNLPGVAGECLPVPAGENPGDECGEFLVCDGAGACAEPDDLEVRGGALECSLSAARQPWVWFMYVLPVVWVLRRRRRGAR